MILVDKFDEVWMRLSADKAVLSEIFDYFSVYAKDFMYNPMYKNHVWNGKINFFKGKQRLMGIGLFWMLMDFAKEREYPVQVTDELKSALLDNISLEDFTEELQELDMSAYGEKIQLRDYQMYGIYSALKNKRRVFVSNTSSGKSAIIYGITRLIEPRIQGKTLIIVPSTNLVEQMYGDFEDYSSDDKGWNTEDTISRLYASHKYDPSKQVLISTWQSLQKKDLDFFEQFKCVIADECHTVKSNMLQKILSQCKDAEYRFGFTGSMPKDKCEGMTIVANLGKVQVLSTTKEAMERGYVANLKINCKVLKHDLTRDLKSLNYQDEIDYLCTLDARTDYICDLARSLEGNTVILTARVDSHGKVIYDKLKENPNGKEVFEIFGDVKVKDRECIRQTMEERSNCITVGNFQCIQQGWSVRNLDNLIFAYPSKSSIRVIQSIGRILRKKEGKDFATLYDIGDSFVKVGKDVTEGKNHTFRHFRERMGIYSEEGFDYTLEEVSINNGLC